MCSVTLGIQGLNPLGQGDEEDSGGFTKNVSRYTMRVPSVWRLIVVGSAFTQDGSASRQDHEKVKETLVN